MKTLINENRRFRRSNAYYEPLASQMIADARKGDYTLIVLFGVFLNKKTVVLNLPPDVPNILVKAKDILEKMTLNATLFDDPTVSMIDFGKHIGAAFAAEAAMENPDTTKTETRNATIAVVVLDCGKLKTYVQTKVDADLSKALEIALSAGMNLKGFTKRGKQQWGVHYTGMTGEVECQGSTRKTRCAYEWQRTLTPDNLPSWRVDEITTTLQATTIVKGLTVGKDIYFRYRMILKDGPTQWSDPICIHII
jgi:hypothetical protein